MAALTCPNKSGRPLPRQVAGSHGRVFMPWAPSSTPQSANPQHEGHAVATKRMAKRIKLPKADAEMKRWCALLEEEISVWPHVSSRPMFGMVALYRGKKIFAALPRTRAADTEFSLLIKLPGVQEARLKGASGPGAGWLTFEMTSSADIAEALRWLERAYQKAK